MTPAEYFHELVEPTIAEFEANPASVRHAYAACMFAYHFADAVAVHAGRSKSQVRKELAALATEFWTVEGIATVAKHLEATTTPVKPRIGDTHLGQAAAFASGAYWASGASWAGMPTAGRLQARQGGRRGIVWAEVFQAKQSQQNDLNTEGNLSS
jgi:hypothetical protein